MRRLPCNVRVLMLERRTASDGGLRADTSVVVVVLVSVRRARLGRCMFALVVVFAGLCACFDGR